MRSIPKGNYRIVMADVYPISSDRNIRRNVPTVTNDIPLGRPHERLQYTEPPTLFRQFAKLRSEKDVSKFANRWGFLSTDGALVLSHDGDWLTQGEALSFWLYEASQVAEAIEIWEAVKCKREKDLRKWIEWYNPTSVSYKITCCQLPSSGFIADADNKVEPQLLESLEYPHLYKPARILLQRMINDKLEAAEGGLVRLLRRPDFKFEFGLTSHSLLSIIWLQFAEEVCAEGKGKVKVCAYCKQAFLAKRSSAKYCSNSCSQAAYRIRAKKASITKG